MAIKDYINELVLQEDACPAFQASVMDFTQNLTEPAVKKAKATDQDSDFDPEEDQPVARLSRR